MKIALFSSVIGRSSLLMAVLLAGISGGCAVMSFQADETIRAAATSDPSSYKDDPSYYNAIVENQTTEAEVVRHWGPPADTHYLIVSTGSNACAGENKKYVQYEFSGTTSNSGQVIPIFSYEIKTTTLHHVGLTIDNCTVIKKESW